GVYEVAARAQGQYPVTVDATTKQRRLVRSTAVGMLLPPKAPQPATLPAAGAAQPQNMSTSSALTDAAKIRLAQEVMHDKPFDDVAREIATTWKRLHVVDAKTK
ncbi:MAG: hypothetical protein K0S65_3290, partial [Labilithrix sp.]|nr:hypothetical protein [Labilithrix sp.]